MRFRLTSLTGLLYTALLSIPLVSVLSKVIYVQSNKNAYQSAEITQTTYSRTPKYTQGDINNGLEINKTYHLEMDEVMLIDFFDLQQNSLEFSVLNGGFTYITSNGYLINDWYVLEDDDYLTYQFQFDGNSGYLFMFLNSGNSYLEAMNEVDELSFNGDILITYFDYNYAFDLAYWTNTTYQDYDYVEVESTTLDNVFEYAIDKVIAENNFGKIDFFSYFTSIFMNDNATNNRYIGYVNYYLNYALMVSLAYLLFMLLMWFVNFARKFLDRGMNYDW